ncbi:MAG: hypothetical protein LBR79_01845 [Oscillospiraceae bacterium]|nr:hypothetical protein [Oscillospiraceae bacterium]
MWQVKNAALFEFSPRQKAGGKMILPTNVAHNLETWYYLCFFPRQRRGKKISTNLAYNPETRWYLRFFPRRRRGKSYYQAIWLTTQKRSVIYVFPPAKRRGEKDDITN